MGGPPGELVWVDNVEAKTKNLRLRILLRWSNVYAWTRDERELQAVDKVDWSSKCFLTKTQFRNNLDTIPETRNTTTPNDFERVFYTVRLQAIGAVKQLLVKVQSWQIIPDCFVLQTLPCDERWLADQGDKEQEAPTKQNENREQQDLPEATPELNQYAETPSKRNQVEQNDAAPGEPMAQESDAEVYGKGSVLQSKHLSVISVTPQ